MADEVTTKHPTIKAISKPSAKLMREEVLRSITVGELQRLIDIDVELPDGTPAPKSMLLIDLNK